MTNHKRHNGGWFRDRRIRTKILLVYLPLLLIPFLVLGYTGNAVYSKVVVDKTAKGFADNSALIISRLNGMLANVESSANMLSLNLNRAIENKSDLSSDFDLSRYTAITTQLSLALLVFPDVESALFIDTKGRIYGSHPKIEEHQPLRVRNELYQSIDDTNGVTIWLPMQRREYWVTDVQAPVLTAGKKIVDINSGKTLGILLLNLKESKLSAVLQTMNAEPSAQYLIVDSSGNVVSASKKVDLLLPIGNSDLLSWVNSHIQSADIKDINREKTLLTIRSFEKLGWKLVSVTPLKALTTDLEQIKITLMMIAGVCVLFAAIGVAYLSKWIANPIVRLAKSMKGFQEGDLDGRLTIESKDELGLFAAGFNEMTRRIKSLLANIKFEQKQKREYELALIQSQIKPHFLYNTLDVIYALSEMGRIKDVQRTTKALADFYRLTLNQGKELISIEQEVRILKDYLAIQHIRYSDVFTYSIEVDQEILPHSILKLTVQPVIENAIYHGLKLRQDKGHLHVRGYLEYGLIHIKVSDNGVGMSPEKIRMLLRSPVEEPGSSRELKQEMSFGLRNVNERIRLSFGEQYGLTIESELGKGTTVTITLPSGGTFGGLAYD
ncbi:sensor histidine kinase [Cohnella herbarum]|uniref:histidine kinase n=1 Tax=Cohnella herbarum TaxID=2728023 RepID=A0A7Z2VFE8_9BACL|nr:sensor histidine kinase [Cohnella herbarum]QJD82074.1 sensor histidine kinase [Cohnella herbarum]